MSIDINALFNNLKALFQPAVANPRELWVHSEYGDRAFLAIRDDHKLVQVPTKRPLRASRKHSVCDLDSFAAFLLKPEHDFNPGSVEIMANPSRGTITAVSGPSWERDVVELSLPKGNAWYLWAKHDGERHTVKELREMLRTRRNDIATSSKSVLADLTSIEVSVAKGAKMEMDPRTGLVTFDGVEKTTKVSGFVPDEIVLSIPVYEGGPPYELRVDLIPSLSEGEKPALTFKVQRVDPDKVQAQAWSDLVAAVRLNLPGFLIGIGALDYTSDPTK